MSTLTPRCKKPDCCMSYAKTYFQFLRAEISVKLYGSSDRAPSTFTDDEDGRDGDTVDNLVSRGLATPFEAKNSKKRLSLDMGFANSLCADEGDDAKPLKRKLKSSSSGSRASSGSSKAVQAKKPLPSSKRHKLEKVKRPHKLTGSNSIKSNKKVMSDQMNFTNSHLKSSKNGEKEYKPSGM